jgi:DNA-binding LacI/PurR family transcriptional regulator
MTVSNAFSRPDQLGLAAREDPRRRDRAGLRRPDPAARTLARGSTGTVGILFHGTPRHALSDGLAALFLAVVAEELGRGGLALTLLPNLGTRDVEPVRDVAMDGAIIYSCSPTDEHVSGYAASTSRSCSSTSRRRPLSERHRRRPSGRPRCGHASRRVRAPADRAVHGCTRCSGRPVRPARAPVRLARRARPGRHHAGAAARRAVGRRGGLRRRPRAARRARSATAVLAFSDALAADVLRAAADLRLRVPADVSVVGFDDSPLARRLTPALTTVRQDVVAKGSTAAAELLAAVRARRVGDAAPARHHMLATELVLRETTAPSADAVGGTNGTFVG